LEQQNQHNWLAKLLGYEFEKKYRTGTSNKVVDALSRKFEDQLEDDKDLRVLSKPFWQDF